MILRAGKTQMNLLPLALLSAVTLFSMTASAQAQTLGQLDLRASAQTPPAISSSSADTSAVNGSVTDSEPAVYGPAQTQRDAGALPSYSSGPSRAPFHSLALGFVIGVQGIGVQAATPLANRINLRAGAQLGSISASFTNDGLTGNGQLSLENIYGAVDFYPFRRSSFHLSPGITIHNDTHLYATLLAPGGTSFSLGDANYTSDPTNPIRGFTRFTLGKSVAPRFTVGFGNMIPRTGGHFSFPTEIGFQVISAPTVELMLTGNGCDADGCGDINSNGGAQNIQDEINLLQSDLHPLRIYPLLSTGISYRFGRTYGRVQ